MEQAVTTAILVAIAVLGVRLVERLLLDSMGNKGPYVTQRECSIISKHIEDLLTRIGEKLDELEKKFRDCR